MPSFHKSTEGINEQSSKKLDALLLEAEKVSSSPTVATGASSKGKEREAWRAKFIAYYTTNAPQKVVTITDAIMDRWQGRYEKLFAGMCLKYGKPKTMTKPLPKLPTIPKMSKSSLSPNSRLSQTLPPPGKQGRNPPPPPPVRPRSGESISQHNEQTREELDGLFALWDSDEKGYLDTGDFVRVVEVCKEMERKGRPCSRMGQDLEEGFTMDKRGMVSHIVNEAASHDRTNMAASITATVSKYTDAIKQLRSDELFAKWRSKHTGCVFVRDVQHTIALLNFQDSQDWEHCGWPLSKKQQNMVNRSIPVIREYKVVPVNSAQGRPVVDLVKFRAYMQTAVRTNSSGEQRISFNAVIAKFLQLIRYVEDECPSPTIPRTAAGRYVERDSYYDDTDSPEPNVDAPSCGFLPNMTPGASTISACH